MDPRGHIRLGRSRPLILSDENEGARRPTSSPRSRPKEPSRASACPLGTCVGRRDWLSRVRIVDASKPRHLSPETVADAIADPYARRVLAVCVKQARAVKDIAAETGLALPTTYRHVNRLEEAGLLVVERSALTPDGKKYDLYRSRVRSARIEMDSLGERVTWEPNEATEERLATMWDSLRGQAGRR